MTLSPADRAALVRIEAGLRTRYPALAEALRFPDDAPVPQDDPQIRPPAGLRRWARTHPVRALIGFLVTASLAVVMLMPWPSWPRCPNSAARGVPAVTVAGPAARTASDRCTTTQ